MRDLVLRQQLHELASDASERLHELVQSGEEVPYEVIESGEGSPFCRYEPLGAEFIVERASLIASLASFGPAKAAVAKAGLAGAYLAELGLDASAEPGRQAEDALLALLCRVWEGSSDFALDPARLDAAIGELESCGEAGPGEVEVVVPLIGLQMPVSRLELGGINLVRADAVEAPQEALAPGTGQPEWEPRFLACARCPESELEPARGGDAPPAGGPAAARLAGAITALRLFKPGGVGLGPNAWVRTAATRWRRIATGAGRPRPGGYRIADSELGELAATARAIERRTRRGEALRRAISRFEAGLERRAPLEALNDHLLALRFLLEGGGPAATDLSMRVAALCAPPGERDEVKATVDAALALERELWGGDPIQSAQNGDGAASPVDIAGEIEDLLRAILRDAACGHLGSDLRVAADEILLADGLAAGEGDAAQRGETSEWRPGEVEAEEIGDPERVPDPGLPPLPDPDPEPFPGEPEPEPEPAWEPEEPRRIPEREPLVPARVREREPVARESEYEPAPEPAVEDWNPFVDPEPAPKPQRRRPIGEAEGGTMIEFPRRGPAMRLLDQRPQEQEALRERVSTLFPDPETTEWSVAELDYDRRRRRAEVSQSR